MAKPKRPLISVEDVYKEFVNGEVVTKVLHGISFGVERGEFVALMGPSGSGKSTLMHIMGFLDKLTTGTYYFEGQNVSELSDDELAHMRRSEVGFVFQFFNLLANYSVLENVMLPLVYARVPHAERVKRATKALEAVGLGHRIAFLSNQLSGGERQRVAIARAIVNEPEVVFADEPTGNLDTKTGTGVLEILQDLNDEGHTIVMVTHEEEAAEYAGRVIRLRDGRIESDERNGKRRRGGYRK